MKYVEMFSGWLAAILVWPGMIWILGYAREPMLWAKLALVIGLYATLSRWPLVIQRNALLELSRRGYSVTRKMGWILDDWGADKPGYGTSGYHSVHDLLKAVIDHDYREEIIEEHERGKAVGMTY